MNQPQLPMEMPFLQTQKHEKDRDRERQRQRGILRQCKPSSEPSQRCSDWGNKVIEGQRQEALQTVCEIPTSCSFGLSFDELD